VTRQINTHDTTFKPIKGVETDIIRQGVPDVDAKINTNIVDVCYHSAVTAGIYEFSAHPCFTTTTNVWVSGFEVVFPAANLTKEDSLVFVVFMTKDLLTNWSKTPLPYHKIKNNLYVD